MERVQYEVQFLLIKIEPHIELFPSQKLIIKIFIPDSEPLQPK